MNHNTHKPIMTTDEGGRLINLVPVAIGKYATILTEDFDRLISQGISSTWFLSGDGKGRYYVAAYHYRSKTTGGRISVARLLLGLGESETVAYVTRDRLDLRPENIVRASGYAKGKEIAAIVTTTKKKAA